MNYILFLIDLTFLVCFLLGYRFHPKAFIYNMYGIVVLTGIVWIGFGNAFMFTIFLGKIYTPLVFGNCLCYVYLHNDIASTIARKYRVQFRLKFGLFTLKNIKRGASVIGAAGSGKTESVIYNFLQHFSKYNFCGILHDYKDFELTEIAYPLFRKKELPFIPSLLILFITLSILSLHVIYPMKKVSMRYPEYWLRIYWNTKKPARVGVLNFLPMPWKGYCQVSFGN